MPKPIPTMRLRRLAAELRRLREAQDLSQEEVCERTGMTRSTLYRVENGQRRPQRRTLLQLLDLYRVDEPQRSELVLLLKEAERHGWIQGFKRLPEEYSAYINLEAEARTLRHYEAQLVPGLLQTEEYARALVSGVLPEATAEEVAERVAVRMERQAHLGSEQPLRLEAIIDEAVLHRAVGSPAVMKRQLCRLIEAAELPDVGVRVVPFRAGAHPGMMGAFMIIDFPDMRYPSVVCIENGAGNLFLESSGEIQRYEVMYDHLQRKSLSQDESIELMAELAKGLG